MRRFLVLTFVASFIGSGILSYSRMSSAYLRMVPAAVCAVNALSVPTGTYSSEGITSESYASLTVICPYVEHSGSLKSAVGTIMVDVYDGSSDSGSSGFVWTKACAQPYSGGAKHCGGGRSTEEGAFMGARTLFLSGTDVTDAWGPSFGDDYGTVFVGLGKSSKLYGFATN